MDDSGQSIIFKFTEISLRSFKPLSFVRKRTRGDFFKIFIKVNESQNKFRNPVGVYLISFVVKEWFMFLQEVNTSL